MTAIKATTLSTNNKMTQTSTMTKKGNKNYDSENDYDTNIDTAFTTV